MAREFASIRLSIWNDDDWRALPRDGKMLYWTLVTHPTLSHCGVGDWRPARLAGLIGPDTDDAWVEDVGLILQEQRNGRLPYIVVDQDTEEVLVRSFVRNDELMKQPLLASSVAKAYAATVSAKLRGVVIHELVRLQKEFPDLKGWAKADAARLLSLAQVDPSDCLPSKGSAKGSGDHDVGGPLRDNRPLDGRGLSRGPLQPSTATSTAPKSTLQHTPQAGARENGSATSPSGPSTTSFERFYDLYPKKVGKEAATRAFAKAIKKASVDAILSGVHRYAADPNLPEKQYIPDPATWLNAGRWTDEPSPPPPSRNGHAMSTGEQRAGQAWDIAARLEAQEQATARQIGGRS